MTLPGLVKTCLQWLVLEPQHLVTLLNVPTVDSQFDNIVESDRRSKDSWMPVVIQ